MRLIDCFVELFIELKNIESSLQDEDMEYDDMAARIDKLLDNSLSLAKNHNLDLSYYDMARFPVIGFIDEILLTSTWSGKQTWMKKPLQLLHYNTSNIGKEFYERLNELSMQGPDKDVREVYLHCLGLGFKGRYFRNEDRIAYEEVKQFNLKAMLPDIADKNIDDTILFPDAYRNDENDKTGGVMRRMKIMPVVIGVPVAVLAALGLYYSSQIIKVLNQLSGMVAG